MIEIFIRQTLGTAGTAILEYYRANSVWINLLILGYAAFFFSGRLSYDKLETAARAQLAQRMGEKSANLSLIKKLLQAQPLDWAGVMAASRLPWVSLPGKIYPEPVNTELLAQHFTPERLAKALSEPNAQEPPQD